MALRDPKEIHDLVISYGQNYVGLVNPDGEFIEAEFTLNELIQYIQTTGNTPGRHLKHHEKQELLEDGEF